jgi:hypothetical protein
MRLGSVLGLAGLLAYAVAPGLGFLWFAALVGGVAGASIDVGIAAVISDQTSLASRAAAMAGWNAITGARGIVAAFAMSVLLGAKVVDVRTALLLSAAISAIGVWLFVDAGRARVARAVSAAPVAAPTGAAAAGARLSP